MHSLQIALANLQPSLTYINVLHYILPSIFDAQSSNCPLSHKRRARILRFWFLCLFPNHSRKKTLWLSQAFLDYGFGFWSSDYFCCCCDVSLSDCPEPVPQDWIDDVKEGKGKITYRDGSQFLGDFLDGGISGSLHLHRFTSKWRIDCHCALRSFQEN